ncbi:MAG: DUF488 family protein [Candidatus Sulfotelmatobacter sp.]|jgi:uncharacterized protein YeaO (DUF488 family)
MAVSIKRVYEAASRTDGVRVLVDRLWPRGLTKERAAVDEWLRDLAPSDELRRWYHAQSDHTRSDHARSDHARPQRPQDFQWSNFRKKYLKELAQPEAQDALFRLYQLAHKRKRLTLLFASKNETYNNAVVLKELLDGMRKPPTGTGPAAAYVVRKREAAVRRR